MSSDQHQAWYKFVLHSGDVVDVAKHTRSCKDACFPLPQTLRDRGRKALEGVATTKALPKPRERVLLDIDMEVEELAQTPFAAESSSSTSHTRSSDSDSSSSASDNASAAPGLENDEWGRH